MIEMSVDVVRRVAQELCRAVAPYRPQFSEFASDVDDVVETLGRAADSLDESDGTHSRDAYALLQQAERRLRDLGQMGLPFFPQELRYAALDANKVLHRQLLK